MDIVIFGATGTIGRRILEEALKRNHKVTAVIRNPSALKDVSGALTLKTGDILDSASAASAINGHAVVISAFGPAASDPEQMVVATNSLLAAIKDKPDTRLVTVGGAGSLEVSPGVQLLDTEAFPKEWKAIAEAHRKALEILRRCQANWTCVSPPALIAPGQRTGTYRTALDRLITDDKGESRISAEDYAIAILDEVENPQFAGKRFTVGY